MLEAHRVTDVVGADLIHDFAWSQDEDPVYLSELVNIIEQGRQLPAHTVHPIDRALE